MRSAVVVSMFLLGWSLTAEAQKKGKCTGEPVDSLFLASGPVYRDCEVDDQADLRTRDVSIKFSPPTSRISNGRCYKAEFQFVVDSLGQPELATVRGKSSNDRDMEEAVRVALPGLLYVPARLGGRPVRQVVVYKRSVMTMVRVTTSSGAPVGLPPTRPSMAGC